MDFLKGANAMILDEAGGMVNATPESTGYHIL